MYDVTYSPAGNSMIIRPVDPVCKTSPYQNPKEAKASLGINTNNATPKSHNIDLTMIKEPIDSSPEFTRAVSKYALQNQAAKLLPKSRTKNCLKFPVLSYEPEIWKHTEENRAKYANLARCGSVWNCPCCATTISEHRRSELEQLKESVESKGGFLMMATLTVPHYRQDNIENLSSEINLAFRTMTKKKAWKNFLNKYGIGGFVRVLEVTHSFRNGWHPHIHMMVVFSRPLNYYLNRSLKKDLYNEWSKAATGTGFKKPSYKHGVDIRTHHDMTNYIQKMGNWTLEHEMTKAHMKLGKMESRTPFQLLAESLLNDDKQAGELFKEYAKAFKGKRQLNWSRNLKKTYKIGEKTDQEVVEDSTDESYKLFDKVSWNDWKIILKVNARGTLLQAAKSKNKNQYQRIKEAILRQIEYEP